MVSYMIWFHMPVPFVVSGFAAGVPMWCVGHPGVTCEQRTVRTASLGRPRLV